MDTPTTPTPITSDTLTGPGRFVAWTLHARTRQPTPLPSGLLRDRMAGASVIDLTPSEDMLCLGYLYGLSDHPAGSTRDEEAVFLNHGRAWAAVWSDLTAQMAGAHPDYAHIGLHDALLPVTPAEARTLLASMGIDADEVTDRPAHRLLANH